MKKLAKGILASLLVVPMAGVFAACESGDPININDATVSLSYTETDYDGSAKEPAVTITYQGKAISRDEYVVTYEDNIDAGTAYAIIRAARDTKELVGNITLQFTINKSNVYADKYDEVLNSLANPSYKAVILESDITVPYGATLSIAGGQVVDFADYTFANHGTIVNNGTILTKKDFEGDGEVINNGDIIASVSSKEALLEAFEYSNYIKLAQDIKEADGYLGDIRFVTKHDYDFTLDLNGKTLESELDIFKYEQVGDGYIHYPHSKVDITITDTSVSRTGSLGSEESDYGLYVRGTDNYKINIVNATLKGGWGGLYTNGSAESAEAQIIAINSRFVGTASDGFGAFVASNYSYIFTNCEFTGSDGYYAKSGRHTFVNCSFYANGEAKAEEYAGSGANGTGSGINIDSCKGGYAQVLSVDINGGFIKSENGYGIYEYSTSPDSEKISYGTAAVSGNVVYLTELDNIKTNNKTVSTQ